MLENCAKPIAAGTPESGIGTITSAGMSDFARQLDA